MDSITATISTLLAFLACVGLLTSIYWIAKAIKAVICSVAIFTSNEWRD